MPCESQTFFNFKANHFQALIAKAGAAGVVITPSHSGQAKAHGATIEWEFDETGSTLTIICVSKPFFISCKLVNDEILKWVNDAIFTATPPPAA